MAQHRIEPDRPNLHGRFSHHLAPILTIDSGDTVCVRTLDAAWHLEPRHTSNPSEVTRKVSPRDPERDDGHALCGPIAIRGAEPGMVLGVRIDSITLDRWGWTAAGGWQSPLNSRLGVADAGTFLVWRLDPVACVGEDQHGHRVPLRPFMGVMGVAPAEPGWHSTAPPRPTGGNLDCRELVAGSTLYLPIAVSGGLFSVGDGHAAQGDGEIGGTAIECPIDECHLTLTLHPDQTLTLPRAETPAGWLTFGFHEDVDEAIAIAVDQMLLWMGERYGIDRVTALGLASVAAEVRVTQMVNGTRGAHVLVPHHALRVYSKSLA